MKKKLTTSEMKRLSGTVTCSSNDFRDCMSYYKYWYSFSYNHCLDLCNERYGLNCK